MFIGDATDPVKRIGTGGRHQTDKHTAGKGWRKYRARRPCGRPPTCRLRTLRQRLRLDKENHQ